MVLSCKICLEDFSPQVCPHTLDNCGHTICVNCIKRIMNKKCPLCRSSFKKSFPNYELIENIKSFSENIIDKIICIETMLDFVKAKINNHIYLFWFDDFIRFICLLILNFQLDSSCLYDQFTNHKYRFATNLCINIKAYLQTLKTIDLNFIDRELFTQRYNQNAKIFYEFLFEEFIESIENGDTYSYV
jgi:hypothetical protein